MAKQNTVLLEFDHYTRVLAELLRENPPLTAVDQLLIENHLQAVHLAYNTWKRHLGFSDQEGPPDQDIPVAR